MEADYKKEDFRPTNAVCDTPEPGVESGPHWINKENEMGEMADELREQAMLAQLDEELLCEQTYHILNKGIWPSKEGEISIEKMTDQHLVNAINYMERNPNIIIAEAGGIEFLKAEQKRRTEVDIWT